MAATLGEEALGAQVISMASSPSDVLAVKLMQAETWDRDLLEDLCQTMADASICGLGQAALNPILSLMERFPEAVPDLSRGER